MKKTSLSAILLVALVAPGCAWFHHGQSASGAQSPAGIVTPDMSPGAKVVSVNTVGRFVVLLFPADQMPKMDQTFSVYRSGMKVAEVKITGPQQENNIVADLVTGDAQVGDVVRAD